MASGKLIEALTSDERRQLAEFNRFVGLRVDNDSRGDMTSI